MPGFNEAQEAFVEEAVDDSRGASIRDRCGRRWIEGDKVMRPADLGVRLKTVDRMIGGSVSLCHGVNEPDCGKDLAPFSGRKLADHIAQSCKNVGLVEGDPMVAKVAQLLNYVRGVASETIDCLRRQEGLLSLKP